MGSGGSFSLARYASHLHEETIGSLSRADTPLGAIQGEACLGNVAVILMSARGRNPDILAAFRKLARQEPARLLVVCSTVGSPLSKLARRYDEGSVLEFECPAGRDGFLATNSLLATAVLLLRSFLDEDSERRNVPNSLAELLPNGERVVRSALAEQGFLKRETLFVLHGKHTHVAATDLESKLTEAALARVHVSDFRNFAHGRHHWFAKRSGESAVLSIESKFDEDIFERTSQFLPKTIPRVRLRMPHQGCVAGLAGLVSIMYVTSCYGDARSIDPGRPGVPEFGRRLYHLRLRTRSSDKVSEDEAIVFRKLRSLGASSSIATKLRSYLHKELRSAVEKLHGVRFESLVLDYDGTFCHHTRRFEQPERLLSERLVRLSKKGLTIGFATGRGKSIRTALRKVFPKSLWNKVVVGYYNCGEIGLLSEDGIPEPEKAMGKELNHVAQILSNDRIITELCELTLRSTQVTVTPRDSAVSERAVWLLVSEAIAKQRVQGIQVLSSTHSVDVLPWGRTKLGLLEYLGDKLGIKGNILCIGDRGAWPGNDFALLNHLYSLSVDECAASPGAAWNLAPSGLRGTRALGFYLRHLKATGTGAVLTLPQKERRRRS